jgi:hypothetical protein
VMHLDAAARVRGPLRAVHLVDLVASRLGRTTSRPDGTGPRGV